MTAPETMAEVIKLLDGLSPEGRARVMAAIAVYYDGDPRPKPRPPVMR